MKIRLFKIAIALLLCFPGLTPPAHGCVGRILYIGTLDTPESRLFSELLVILINERTGTNVKIRMVNEREGLYTALNSHEEEQRIDIIVENTAEAMSKLRRERIADPDQEYTEAKTLYEKELALVWLNPFGFKSGGGKNPALSAPVIRQDVLTNFPLLPRILNKLAGAIDDQTYAALLGKVKGGDKPRNVAKDFLRDRKFI